MAFKQEINLPLIVTIGLVSGILLLVAVVGTEAWYDNEEQIELASKSAEVHNVWLENLTQPQLARLGLQVDHQAIRPVPTTQAYCVDQDRHIAGVPINDAIDILIQTRGNLPTTQPSTTANN